MSDLEVEPEDNTVKIYGENRPWPVEFSELLDAGFPCAVEVKNKPVKTLAAVRCFSGYVDLKHADTTKRVMFHIPLEASEDYLLEMIRMSVGHNVHSEDIIGGDVASGLSLDGTPYSGNFLTKKWGLSVILPELPEDLQKIRTSFTGDYDDERQLYAEYTRKILHFTQARVDLLVEHDSAHFYFGISQEEVSVE